MKTYFEKIPEEQKELIIRYFYTPTYEKKMVVNKTSVDIENIKEVHLDDKYYKGFLADVLSFDNYASPIFWEIAVTHKCEESKINSNVKIIENFNTR